MANCSNWVSLLIVLYLPLLPWTLVNAAEKNIDFCETLPDDPFYSPAIQTQLDYQLGEFKKEMYADFYAVNNYVYQGFCNIFLGVPERPRQILTAFWLKFTGYVEKIKRIHSKCVEDNKKSLKSVRELCKLAITQMQATSKQHTRDIQYLMDNVRHFTHVRFSVINHKNELNFSILYLLQTVDISCTDLGLLGECDYYNVTCLTVHRSRDQQVVNGYARMWKERDVNKLEIYQEKT